MVVPPGTPRAISAHATCLDAAVRRRSLIHTTATTAAAPMKHSTPTTIATMASPTSSPRPCSATQEYIERHQIGHGNPKLSVPQVRVSDDPEAVSASQRARGEDEGLVDQLLSADERRRGSVSRADALRAQQKQFGRQVGKAKGEERDALPAKASRSRTWSTPRSRPALVGRQQLGKATGY